MDPSLDLTVWEEIQATFTALVLGVPLLAIGIYQLKTKKRIIEPHTIPRDVGAISTGIACIVVGIGIVLIDIGFKIYRHFIL